MFKILVVLCLLAVLALVHAQNLDCKSANMLIGNRCCVLCNCMSKHDVAKSDCMKECSTCVTACAGLSGALPSQCDAVMVVLLQTAALVAISVFGFSLGMYYLCLALTAGLAATMVLHAWMRPYASMVAGRTSLRGLACVTFTSFAALSFLQVGSICGQMHVNQAYALTAGAFVLVVNVVYVMSVAVQLLGAVKWTALVVVARRVLGAFCAKVGRQQGEKSDAPR